MKKDKLGQESAFPNVAFDKNGIFTHNDEDYGMSKRFYAACVAMQGMLSNEKDYGSSYFEIIERSYQLADELLKQELK